MGNKTRTGYEPMRIMLYVILQCTWGLCQTAVGLAVFLANRGAKHMGYHGAIVTVWNRPSSVSLGLFVFITQHPPLDRRSVEKIPDDQVFQRTLVHEYGHTIQSLLLGPLYLLVIGVPSFLWMRFLGNWRTARDISYFSFYTEKWANRWGELAAGEKSMEDALVG